MHCDFACMIYNKHIVNKLPKESLEAIITEAVIIEKTFVTDSIPVALIGMNAEMMCQYIEFCADRLLISLGNPKVYGSENPFPWMDLISMRGKTNFFEKRVGDYQKAGVTGGHEQKVFSIDEDF